MDGQRVTRRAALAAIGGTGAMAWSGRTQAWQPSAVSPAPSAVITGPPAVAAAPPAEGDDTPQPLRQYVAELLASYGGDSRRVPLSVKAALFDWMLWRYHFTPWRQAHNRVFLPRRPGEPSVWPPGADTSTWNGALLAAMSYKYAVTRDVETRARIEQHLHGLRFYQDVTGYRGFAARSICPADGPVLDHMLPHTAADGQEWRYWGQPAKGTYNQLAAGYAAALMLTERDLAPAAQQQARDDLTALVLHVVDHDYHLTDAQGERTPYGDITPLVGSAGVPFNAQVAYLIVAAGQVFPPDDPAERERIAAQFRRLRGEHHAYYDKPLTNLVSPQRVAASPFVKGMNDRMHVISAAHMGLALERFDAPRRGETINEKFTYRLGRTLFHGANQMRAFRNSLCNFMCAGILQDEATFDLVVPTGRAAMQQTLGELIATGIEQLRRFPLDRFFYPGRELNTPTMQWVDRFRPEDYYWKCDPTLVWQPSGPADNELYCAIDYLYAYWLLRFYGLDRHPAAAPHAGVLEA